MWRSTTILGLHVRGQTALITYMRTDSTHLSGDALGMARGYIGEQFGPGYLPDKPNFFSSSNKSAQEAHEAIRPAGETFRTPEELKRELDTREWRLYDLIWKRAIATQMKPAQIRFRMATIAVLEALFRASGREVLFPGFLRDLFPGNATLLLYGFGITEIIIALWILIGRNAFIPSILASLYLSAIVIFNIALLDIVFRDISILAMTLALLVIEKGVSETPKRAD